VIFFKECDECPELIVVPKGNLRMGSPPYEKGHKEYEGPEHSVTLSEDVAIGRYEITNRQYVAFLNSTIKTGGKVDERWVKSDERERASHILFRIRSAGSFYDVEDGFEDHPVAYVSWEEATAYTRWLSTKTRASYRLPTEAEWEYSARAGTQTPHYFGYNPTEICTNANVADKTAQAKYTKWTVHTCSDGYADTAPVGKFKSNGFGLYDVYGNVSEWVEDCWHSTYYGAPANGSAWVTEADCNTRVVRGGSFQNVNLRSAIRFRLGTLDQLNTVGFRVLRTLRP
jgi:formylglycine-generating enzyme required for sulfatase activity